MRASARLAALVAIGAATLVGAGCVVQPAPVYVAAAGDVYDLDPPPGDEVWTVDAFYDELAPYGTWSEVDGYGAVWSPADPSYEPYGNGAWAYTAWGFTWVSAEPYGWACEHYGHWIWLDERWIWVPDTAWAPAWVEWQELDD